MQTQALHDLPKWFCIHTKPLHELQAVRSLKRFADPVRENVGDLEVYFPRVMSKMTVAGHLRSVIRPLFPRYFFAKFIWAKAARFVVSRPYINGLVQFGDKPAIVPPEVIEDLITWSLDSDVEFFDPTARLNPGQRVFIKSGLFKGVEAEFISHLNDQKRVTLLLDHLQSQARLIVDRSVLKPIV